jgi:hypothetical protein
MNYTVSIVVLAATIAVPILFAIFVFGARKLKFFLLDILVGIIVTYFAQIILSALLINGCSFAFPAIMSNSAGQQIVYVAASTVAFLLGYYLIFIIGYKKQFSEGQVSRITIGTLFTKVLGDTLSAALSNMSVAQHLDAGTLAEYIAQATSSMQGVNVEALTTAYSSFSIPQFSMPAILTLLAMQTVYLFLILLGEHKPIWQQVILVAIYCFFYYYTLSFPVPTLVVVGAIGFLIVELYMTYVLMNAQINRVLRNRTGSPASSPSTGAAE